MNCLLLELARERATGTTDLNVYVGHVLGEMQSRGIIKSVTV